MTFFYNNYQNALRTLVHSTGHLHDDVLLLQLLEYSRMFFLNQIFQHHDIGLNWICFHITGDSCQLIGSQQHDIGLNWIYFDIIGDSCQLIGSQQHDIGLNWMYFDITGDSCQLIGSQQHDIGFNWIYFESLVILECNRNLVVNQSVSLHFLFPSPPPPSLSSFHLVAFSLNIVSIDK